MKSARDTTEITMVIRNMTKADIAQVVALEKAIFSDPWSVSAFQEQISSKNSVAQIAEQNGDIIGFSCYYLADIEFHLTNIAVSPAYRRKSVAKRLLESILQLAIENHCEYVLLEVRPSNQAARAFYEKHGFTLLYQRPDYYRYPVEDALVMVRYLDDSG